MNLQDALARYIPCNEQEQYDRAEMLRLFQTMPDLYTRDNRTAHLTASGWITCPTRDRVLLAYHNLYDSWAWLGGHADGDRDLLAVALREAREESGLNDVHALRDDIFSLELLTVNSHWRRGQYVPGHLHLNVTFLLEADPHAPLHSKPDENSGVAWFSLDDAVAASKEAWFRDNVYSKLNAKLRLIP